VRDRDNNRARLGGEDRRAMKGASLGWFFDNSRRDGRRGGTRRAMSGDGSRNGETNPILRGRALGLAGQAFARRRRPGTRGRMSGNVRLNRVRQADTGDRSAVWNGIDRRAEKRLGGARLALTGWDAARMSGDTRAKAQNEANSKPPRAGVGGTSGYGASACRNGWHNVRKCQVGPPLTDSPRASRGGNGDVRAARWVYPLDETH